MTATKAVTQAAERSAEKTLHFLCCSCHRRLNLVHLNRQSCFVELRPTTTQPVQKLERRQRSTKPCTQDATSDCVSLLHLRFFACVYLFGAALRRSRAASPNEVARSVRHSWQHARVRAPFPLRARAHLVVDARKLFFGECGAIGRGLRDWKTLRFERRARCMDACSGFVRVARGEAARAARRAPPGSR